MTGFIRGLFSRNNNQQGGAYYLSEDDAKTMGDIDYMRSSKTIEHTFSKKKGETGDKRSVKSVSAMKSTKLNERMLPKTPQVGTFGQSTAAQPAPEAKKFERRSADSNMDMFRNMAKQIRK